MARVLDTTEAFPLGMAAGHGDGPDSGEDGSVSGARSVEPLRSGILPTSIFSKVSPSTSGDAVLGGPLPAGGGRARRKRRPTRAERERERRRAELAGEFSGRRRPKRLRTRIFDICLLAVALGCIGAAGYQWLHNRSEQNDLGDLSSEFTTFGGNDEGVGSHTGNPVMDAIADALDGAADAVEGAVDAVEGAVDAVSGGGDEAGGEGFGGGGGGGANEGEAPATEEDLEPGGSWAGGVNWDGLSDRNVDSAAWMRIENTPIDYPVLQATADDPEYWLHHEFDGTASYIGAPFLDYRTTADGRNRLVFAHHLGDTGMMFSSIYGTWSQDVFNSLGNCLWTTQGQGTETYRPLFAQVVDMEDMRPQTFEWESDEAFIQWLLDFGSTASSHAEGWEEAARNTRHVVIACTCANAYTGLRERTVTVFCDGF